MQTETNETIQGQRQRWNLIKKLGEGDAGEVYQVEASADNQQAILKRPRRGSFFSDILRQASQIRTEGSILLGLARAELHEAESSAKHPNLDRSEWVGTRVGRANLYHP